LNSLKACKITVGGGRKYTGIEKSRHATSQRMNIPKVVENKLNMLCYGLLV